MIGKIKSKWKKPPIEYGIYSILEFAILLKRERIRVDRTDSQFSMVLFKVNTDEYNKNIKKLIAQFKEHIREIDYIGWHDNTSIGIILPETGYTGAEHFISHFKQYTQAISCENRIICYPENQNNNQDQNSEILKDDFSSEIPGWKIILDKMGAIAGFILFSPVFLLLPLYIRLVSPGPVFYSQTRIGYKGRTFTFWKFRTMHIDTDTESHNDHLKMLINSDKPMTKLDEKDDPRIIPGGRILRKCCLDEIPQIYRFDINPGLTGLWQVSGKNKLTFKEMIRLDIKYSQNISLLLDLRIITATIPAIFKMVFESIQKHLGNSETAEQQHKIQRRNI